ncbi:MAG TPA: 3-isopropylmalate dehydratase large subunit [Gammaproteobacteria bacterium]|nr:3-isopropylmalate dehydratase large subunit [Gammaproteobacteria bacterium]
MKPKNIIEKIWDAHTVAKKPGHPTVFAIDFTLLHEVTSAQAFHTLRERAIPVYNPELCLATIDHSIPTRKNRHEIFDAAAKKQVELLRENAHHHKIPFYDFDSSQQGIVHVVGPELGATQPGMTIVCGDSHTSTHGAFGALAFGIGTSELTNVLASGCLLLSPSKVMRVHFTGHFQKGVFAKDAIMKLIAEIGIGGANGHVIEYTGEAISAMSMEERMTICNMSIECGARAGLIAPDETTYRYLKDRPYAPKGAAWEQAVARWKTLPSDPGCHYDKDITIDIGNLQPMVTWGTNPAQAVQINENIPKLTDLPANERTMAQHALEYVHLHAGEPIANTPVDWAFIGSCTNGRIEDLRVAAKILQGKKVHPNVTMYVVPGSEAVMEAALAEGLDKIFQAAGADFRMPGCSMCLGMNDDKVPAGKRCISATNRNFVGRQGTGSFTHLASPATVAASAIAGKIVSPQSYF